MALIIIIVFLWILLGFVLYRILRKRPYAFSYPQILVFFGAKIVAGAAYGYMFRRWYNGDDTWGLHHDGLLQYQRLVHTPRLFLADIFSAMPVPATGAYYFQSASYIENLEYCIVGKILALFNCVSGGEYYINVVLLNFFGFFGLYLFYRLIAPQIREAAHKHMAILLFLFPPAVFWLSGIRAECFLLNALAVLFYFFLRALQSHSARHFLYAIAGGLFAFIFRSALLLALLPPLLAWWLTVRFRLPIQKSLLYVLTGGGLVILAAGYLPANVNPLHKIAERQQSFFELKGNTRFNLTPLEPTPSSFIKVMPEAIVNTTLRPFAWEAKGVLQYFSAAENLFVLALLAAAIVSYIRSGRTITGKTLMLVLLTSALLNYLLIGYIVPFPGAIIRYKIIAEWWLLAVAGLLLWGETQRTTASSQI